MLGCVVAIGMVRIRRVMRSHLDVVRLTEERNYLVPGGVDRVAVDAMANNGKEPHVGCGVIDLAYNRGRGGHSGLRPECSSPWILPQPLANSAPHYSVGITRSSVATRISNLTAQVKIRGRGSVVADEPFVVVIGGANVDIEGRCSTPALPHESNPGAVAISAGGVARNIAANLASTGLQTPPGYRPRRGRPRPTHLQPHLNNRCRPIVGAVDLPAPDGHLPVDR